METLAAVLLYLEAINGDNSYTFETIESIEDANQQEVNAVYDNEEELDYVKTHYLDDVEIQSYEEDDGDVSEKVYTDVGPFDTDDGNEAY